MSRGKLAVGLAKRRMKRSAESERGEMSSGGGYARRRHQAIELYVSMKRLLMAPARNRMRGIYVLLSR